MKRLLLSFGVLFTTLGTSLNAQTVAINTTGAVADASAILDVSSTTKGFLIPRMTTQQQALIPLPATGLAVYNITVNSYQVNTGTPAAPNWLSLSTSSDAWGTKGTAGTLWTTNFIGTTDDVSLRFRTKNLQRMIIDSATGNVAIGASAFDNSNAERLLVDAGITNSVNAIYARGTIDNYLQMNIRNLSQGTQASSDIVATADNGTETTNFIDMGINGSKYVYNNGNPIETGKANDGYIISSGSDFYLVNNNPNKAMLFLTGGTGVANERMRIMPNGRVGMGVQDPTSQFVVKDTMEIRRTANSPLSQLLFTNTGGTGDFRIGGDGGDLFWQGGGGRNLQMGSYWTTILTGDRQLASYPAHVSAVGGTGVLVLGQRDASIPLAVQSNSASQTANLTEWRNTAGTVLSSISKDGYLNLGSGTPVAHLTVNGSVSMEVTTVTGTYTATANDYTILVNSTSAVTINLPTATGIDGRIYVIKKIGTGTNAVTIDPSGTQTVDGATTRAITTQYTTVTVQASGGSWFIL